jgi:two-component system LytT family sensor kinase
MAAVSPEPAGRGEFAWSRRARGAFVLAWLLFWLLMVAVAVQDILRSEPGTALWKPVLWESSSMLVATVLMLTQLRLTRRWHHLLAFPWRWFGIQALWLPYYWLLFTPLAFGIRHGVYALAGETYSHRPVGELFFYESLKITVFIGLLTAVRFGVLSYQALLQEKVRAERATGLLRQAQLQRLGQQMQPHFLFNALNTISSLMHSDVDKADATLMELAGVLRATLDASDSLDSTLQAELDLVRAYAQVMLARFGERASIQWRIAPDCLACRVPVMSLQPLLENIFKHTVEQRRGMTQIVVSAVCEGACLRLSMEDDTGALAPSTRAGIGLVNLRERLAMLHGDAASLTLEQLAPAGVRASMVLPCGC